MLFSVFAQFVDSLSFLNVFRYITFRTGGAMMTALIVSFVCGPFIIRWLKAHQGQGQPIREDGPASLFQAWRLGSFFLLPLGLLEQLQPWELLWYLHFLVFRL